jgi:hypothetical protein
MRSWRRAILIGLGAVAISAGCVAQQGAASGEPLVFGANSFPKAFLKQSYEAHLEAKGGITPLNWTLEEGELPAGITLSRDGTLNGTPTKSGEFRFTVKLTDSGKPAAQKSQQLTLTVEAPLMLQWSRYPKVTGPRLEGAVKVSNQTGQDFDLTVVMMAVNQDGRATAIGYQRIDLKKNTDGLEIPFGENLPQGVYELNVDAVAEVAATNSIYRARLVPKEKMQIVQGP